MAQERKNKQETMEKKSRPRFTTLDLLYIAICGVMGGFVSSYIPFNAILKNAFPPPNPYTWLLSAHHMLWMVLAHGLTGKRFSAFSTSGVKGVLEFMLGDAYFSFWIIPLNLFEGIMVEVGLLLLNKAKTSRMLLWVFAGAGGIGNVFTPLYVWTYSSKIFIYPWYFTLMACTFAFVSGIFMAGMLGFGILKSLEKSGVKTKISLLKSES
ncbi:MAG: ECF transporter S component [Promethearchaeota archaeon]